MPETEINDKPSNRWKYQILVLALIGAIIWLSFTGGNLYACNGTGKLINHRCYTVVNVGYCTDYSGNNYLVDSSINYSKVEELNLTP